MDNHFLRFKVQNFKGFQELNLPDLGLFNFIVGDNNTGKTSLLEALMFNPEGDFSTLNFRWANVLHNVRSLKYFNDYAIIYYLNRNLPNWQQFAKMSFEIQYLNKDEAIEQQSEQTLVYDLCDTFTYEIEIRNQNKAQVQKKINLNLNDLSLDGYYRSKVEDELKAKNMSLVKDSISHIKLPYVPFNRSYDEDLTEKYANIQFDDAKQEALIKNLKILIPNIKYIEPSAILKDGRIALIIRREGAATLPLASLGEGAIKLFRLLTEISEWSSQRLMIDEIDNGLHHSRLAPFLQTVLNAAQQQDTQLFATTHSLECLQTLHDVLQSPDNAHLREKVRIIHLANTSTKGVQAYTYQYEDFHNAIILENEIR